MLDAEWCLQSDAEWCLNIRCCGLFNRYPPQGGLAIDPTTPKCRNYIWDSFLKPRYFDKVLMTWA